MAMKLCLKIDFEDLFALSNCHVSSFCDQTKEKMGGGWRGGIGQ